MFSFVTDILSVSHCFKKKKNNFFKYWQRWSEICLRWWDKITEFIYIFHHLLSISLYWHTQKSTQLAIWQCFYAVLIIAEENTWLALPTSKCFILSFEYIQEITMQIYCAFRWMKSSVLKHYPMKSLLDKHNWFQHWPAPFSLNVA